MCSRLLYQHALLAALLVLQVRRITPFRLTRDSFHWMDFQTYAFQLLASNEFRGRVYQCSITASGCACPYPSSIASAGQCQIAGEDVLDVRTRSHGLIALTLQGSGDQRAERRALGTLHAPHRRRLPPHVLRGASLPVVIEPRACLPSSGSPAACIHLSSPRRGAMISSPVLWQFGRPSLPLRGCPSRPLRDEPSARSRVPNCPLLAATSLHLSAA